MVWAARIGLWMVEAGTAALVVEIVIGLLLVLNLRRAVRDLQQLTAEASRSGRLELDQVNSTIAETRLLWRPYRRAWKYVRHPLVIALAASYRRRRRMAGAGSH